MTSLDPVAEIGCADKAQRIAGFRQHHQLADLLQVAGMARSTFYYQCQASLRTRIGRTESGRVSTKEQCLSNNVRTVQLLGGSSKPGRFKGLVAVLPVKLDIQLAPFGLLRRKGEVPHREMRMFVALLRKKCVQQVAKTIPPQEAS